jgi:hypothetical protein
VPGKASGGVVSLIVEVPTEMRGENAPAATAIEIPKHQISSIKTRKAFHNKAEGRGTLPALVSRNPGRPAAGVARIEVGIP